MSRKQSSPELSTLAARILSGKRKASPEDIKRLAGSVLSQDTERGQRVPRKASEQSGKPVSEQPPVN